MIQWRKVSREKKENINFTGIKDDEIIEKRVENLTASFDFGICVTYYSYFTSYVCGETGSFTH